MAQDNARDKVEVRKDYYESGALYSEAPFVKGKKHGIEKRYYESSALWREIPYVNGKRYGIDKTYYESGALMFEVPYKYGIKHGIAKHYDKDNINIDCLMLYKRSHEVLTLCLEGYSTVSTKT